MATSNEAAPTPVPRTIPLAIMLALALPISLARPAIVRAATVQLDTGLAGSDFDAILDGFPGLAPYDGVGDLPGNALAVSLKANVTEERAFVELPLATLLAAGATPDNVVEATLTFNIDDVLTTFGPGTDFDSSAAEHILISTYAGNGNVDLDDYPRGTLAATVQTGPQGSITDASVRAGGPIKFQVDLTASVKSLLTQNATHIGIAFSTDDSPTGTSIDNMGDSGVGPPGANGSTMPFLVVKTADATPTPAPTSSPVPTSPPTVSPAPTTSPGPGATPSPGPTPPGTTPTPAPTASPGPGITPTPPAPTPKPTSGATATPGGATPQPTAAPTPSGAAATPTPGASRTPSASATPAGSSTPAASATPGASTTPSSSATPGTTSTPATTGGPQLTPTPHPILTQSPRPTSTPGGSATPAPTGNTTAPSFTLVPDGSGDQLVFYYDARESFTTFLNLHNLGPTELDVRVVLYDAELAQPFEEAIALPAGATRTIDVGVLRGNGLPARFGAAFASAVDASGAALVTRALGGSFTVANVATGSAWGAPAAARRAVAVASGGVTTPPVGTEIDGGSVRLRALRPDGVGLPVYYDPQTLEPAALSGNQLIFLSFDDMDGLAPDAVTTTWSLAARRNDGARIEAGSIAVSGVVVSHLEALLGASAGGAAGSIVFTTADGADNRLVFFSESLGTFATGYLLPPVAP